MVPTSVKRILPTYIKHPLWASTRLYWQMRGLPEQSWRDISIFKEVLSKVEGRKLRIFEWGSGSSTVYYPKFLRSIGRQFDWYAVDNCKEWFQRGQEKIANAGLTGQVQIFCFDFPAFWQVPGYSYDNPVPPQNYTSSANVTEYVDCPKQLTGRFDVIIVDGRFRRRCLEVAAELLAPQGIVILHDANRAHYHSSLALYPHVQFLETGLLPGMSQRSDIALCSFDSDAIIRWKP